MTIDKIIIPYRRRPLQAVIHKNLFESRWSVVICHRRFGKSLMGVNHLIRAAMKRSAYSDRRYGYLAPTYRQGKDIAWTYMKHYSEPLSNVRVNESALSVTLENGSKIQIFGATNPDALRGGYFDGVLLDEYELMKEELFAEVIRPMLVDRNGFAIFMGTPKGVGNLKQKWDETIGTKGGYCAMFKASETGIIPPGEIADIKLHMTPAQYEQEFECSFDACTTSNIFRRDWWGEYVELPAVIKRVVWSFDTAFKTGEESDFTSGHLVAEVENGYFVVDEYHKRVAFPDLKRDVQELYDRDVARFPNVRFEVLIEDKASGQSLLQELRATGKLPIVAIRVDRDKITRANAAAPMVAAGNVYLPQGEPWAFDFREELAYFPNHPHDDRVDSFSQAINYLRGPVIIPGLTILDGSGIMQTESKKSYREIELQNAFVRGDDILDDSPEGDRLLT